jgi:thiosulfate/3-mercaptopyruvate sulfurtransferase
MFTTLIDSPTLSQHIEDNDWVLIDCRFSLADTTAGRRAYEKEHIMGAVYAHLDHDLSGPPVTDNGRHPLPTPVSLIQLFSRLGIDRNKQVIVYDDANGMVASRLWWMLRYMGHEAVAVLAGGWQAWKKADLPIFSGTEINPPAIFTGSPRSEWLVQIDEVPDVPLLIDSRSPDRYRGENETIDAQAGHIPRAVNYFYQDNWSKDGRYLPPAQLQERLTQLLGDTPANEAVFYCGSGVSACANLLALTQAGLGNGRLYVGSWSEWSRDEERPIATGDTNFP